jgi:3-oxoadipate enol-lactonase
MPASAGSDGPAVGEIVAVGDARLALVRHRGEGPWVTLVHGGLVGSWGWRAQLPSLTKPNLRRAGQVLALDQRGYGESSAEGPHDIATLAGDLVALWDRLGIERTYLVGFSLGGFVSLEAAALAPERVAGLILEGCAEPAEEARESLARRAEELDAGAPDAIAEHVFLAFSETFRVGQPELIADYTAVARQVTPSSVAESLRSIAAWYIDDSHRALDLPLLAVCGEHDRAFGPPRRDALAAAMRRAETATLKNAGHTAHLECAPGFNHLVVDFIERTTA